MAKLIENTVVLHPQTGEPALLAGGGDLPDWAVDLVGDHLLDGPVQRSPKPAAVPSPADDETARLRARIAELEAASRTPEQPPAPKVPPMRGTGSGADDWRAYARSVEVEVADDASREDVVAALTAAGKPIK